MSHGMSIQKPTAELPVSFFTPEFFAFPYATYDLLRSRDPVYWSAELDRWVLTRYDDVARVLRGPEFTAKPKHNGLFRNEFTFMDGKEHSRIRKLLNPYFRPEIGKAMRERLGDVAEGFLQRAVDVREIDFVNDVANPIAMEMVTHALSLPREDGPLLLRWTAEIVAGKGIAVTEEAKLKAVESFQVMTRYVREFLDDFPNSNREGYVAAELIRARKKRVLTEDELSTTLMVLIMAAIETTRSVLSSGLLALLKNPAEITKLVENPSLARNAVEEMLRYEAPLQWVNRLTRDDMEIRGKKIAAGQSLLQIMGAANRDPSEFPDPHAFRVDRPNAAKHVSFGGGAHFCLGASMGREASHVVVERLIPYLPGIRSLEQKETWQSRSLMFRRLESLRVEFRPRS